MVIILICTYILDHIIEELKSRFSDQFFKIIPIEGLIPIHTDSYNTKALVKAEKFYAKDLHSSSELVLKAEINLWNAKRNKIETNVRRIALFTCMFYHSHIEKNFFQISISSFNFKIIGCEPITDSNC